MGAGYSMKARANEAEVYIYEDVGEGWFGGVSAKQFAADLKALGAVDTINVHINSYGGEVFDGVAIYRQLVDHKARVVSHIDGVAASIASVIAMAGDEIRITEAGFIMIHNASGGVFGQAADMRQMADLLDTISATIADVYVARTGQDQAAVQAMMQAETWLTAADSIAKKFADQVVENLRVAASADPRALYGDKARPKNRRAADLIAHARETLPAMFGVQVDGVAVAPIGPAAVRRAPSALSNRIQQQAAKLAARAPASAA
jgi:ATP-dependent protease ClpP protease subunit